ncbi:amino acid adenylation domain-containing protein [Corallococcus sp. AB011P]|uniref:non-ribosomal peptide synthetase n=1 Tax=Corallococcus sp. AB011P TaxID=2316735 RepID=UPI000EA35BE3|nr:non-ribosomal peptide synthase/polyketide synthase [Corallococcus sp. AB011P]RKG56777.1 amino acid adenylation domain-containing protein [Corallococcus sp. AB011P]
MTTEHPGSPSASAPKSPARPRRRAPPVVPVPRDALLPLSFGQQRMWFIEQLTPGGISYNVPYFARLTGALDIPALERALAVLVERHEALRTTFAVVDGQPVQRIAPSLPLPLRVESLEAFPASEREHALRQAAEVEARVPFDLGAGPLVRVRLLRLGEAEHVLLLMLHHICCDGWSLTVMERELQALYAAFRAGTTPALPALPVQYADHAVWQRQWIQGEHLRQQLEWWQGELSGAPAALELPTDRPRPAAQSTRGAVYRHALPPGLGKALEALCRKQGVTLFMALLGGMHLLLSRLSGQDDIVIGSPISGRTRQEVEPLIGFFINTLPLRVRGEGALGFGELLRRVRKTCLDAYARQEVPFEQLVDALQPERDLSRPPLFQVFFTLQHSAVPALELEGLRTSELDFEPGVSRMDLTVFLRETPEGLVGLWEYSTDLFDAATVARFAEHYTRLLEAAVAEPERPVATLPLLTAQERRHLLDQGTGAAVPYPRDASLPALFAEQAARTPGAVAVEAGGQRLTYAELEARANQLAHHLRAQGVRLGTPVGLCAGRSLEMVVATLAILKAGGAYVPLDPGYPSERLELMARDARITVLLLEQGRESSLKGLASRVVVLDPSWRDFEDQPKAAPDVQVPAEALAYVMYTSGSTGRPKGVGVPHRAVTRLVKGVSYVRFGAEDVVLQLATTSFDAATLELWGALLSGAKLFLYPPVTPSLEELEATLERERISVLFLTTAFFEQMALNRPAALARVAQVLTGGDVLSPLAARKLLDAGRAVTNGYGPTENTTFSATYQVKRDLDARMPVPIGRPLENSQALVLDARLEPVPPGVVGDLYVGGDGLAWGYLDRQDLTADRFVPHPFSDVPGARLYRTGDRARWLPSGELAFMGRADTQVKLRGFRIELGEIETALRHLPGVEDAVAEVREYAPGDKRLVAYVAGASVDVNALRSSLSAQLPAPLVPAAFVKLDRLPLTPVGKVDRRALATPVGDALTEDAYVAPVTPTETAVAEVWAALLGRTRVGTQDSFFELGGHSLLATQVTSRLRETFQVDLSVRALFEAPTVTSLAARIDALRRESSRIQSLPLVPGPRDGWLPQSFAQQRLWLISQLDTLGYSYNVPMVTRLRGALDADALERSLAEVIRRHAVLHTTFDEVDGQPVQRIGPPWDFTLARTDAEAAKLPEQLATEARRPFDLRRGPLMRGLLLRVADDDHVLMLVIHHIVFDGWSIDVLQRELNALYPARGQSTLPPLSLQYVDYARWQRESFQGEELEDQLTWWREALAGAPPVLDLPTDKPRPPVQTFQGANFEVLLPQPLHGSLQLLGQREGATLFMTLLAGFQALLARYSGQEDVVVGSPISGRNRREVEGLIGFFVNTLALRADVSGSRSFRQLLRGVRESCLGAFAHQDLPFEQLVDALKPPRDLSRTPLVQTMFVLQRAATPLSLPGLAVEDFPFQSGVSRFDLMLFMRQTPQGLVAYWEYNSALFEEATLVRMAGHYVRLLEGVTANPEQSLAELSLLSREEREQLLVAWNSREDRLPAPGLIHVWVEAQVERTPDAVAVTNGTESLTYAQLDARANQLAHHLIALGVTPGSSVGLCLERSNLDMPVAVLATLKAGAAYVPLDPNYPAERLALMVEDTRAPVVLAHEGFVRALPPATSARIVTMETVSLASRPTSPPNVRLSPEAVCYVVFTSGSTGRPKGIAMSHRGIGNMLAWQTRRAVRAEATTLQFASLNFDVSFQEIFGAWCIGGRLLLSSAELRRDPPALLRYLTQHRVERLFLPFVALQSLSEAARTATELPPLNEVITAGEQLQVTPAIVALFERLPGCVLENQYGPSETHAVSAWRASGVPSTWPALPPVGTPLPSVQAYVLDPRREPCPVGVPGELYVGGEGLAHGYHGRPDLTAERFVPSPFSTTPGARLYRTGDKARWLADGQLEFLGRLDGQVKLRGFRVELGEVEAALRVLPDVRDVVVVVREDTPGHKRLVAYVVQPEASLSPEALRQALARRLPEHMVPSALVRMDALPLGPSGKVNRNGLPAPREEAADDTGFLAPMTAVEKVIADIWASLLVVPRVGLEDHFFELGGHSLLATQVVSRLREAFQVDLSLRVLFEAPTVAQLAARLEEQLHGANRKAVPPLVPQLRGELVPQSFSQQRLWFVSQLDTSAHAYNLPLVTRLRGRMDTHALEDALNALIRRHEVLRTTFDEVDGQPVQRIGPAWKLALKQVDVEPRIPLQRQVEAEAHVPFDLRRGPLVRATLLRIADEDQILILNFHHSVFDGWSIALLQRELDALYLARSQGTEAALPPISIQYSDYALWQRAWLQGDVLEEQVAWWREQMAGAPPVLDLPTDKPRPPVQTFRGAYIEVPLPPALTSALVSMGQREGTTLFMTLLAGFQALLARYSGQDDVVVGSPISGRNRREVEGLLGLFVNTLALRADVTGSRSFRHLLRGVRESCLGAFAHQDLPFEQLVEALKPPRDLSRAPLVQALFVLQQAAVPFSLPGLQAEDVPFQTGVSRFDLMLFVRESEQGLTAFWEYNTALFEEATLTRMAGHYVRLLQGAVRHPEQPLSALPLLSEEERRQVVVTWNAAKDVSFEPGLMHRWVEAQVERTPEAVAVTNGAESLTYAQLDARANQLAHHLIALGVTPGSSVGLCLERSNLDMPVAVLATLKAGAAYVPLDPNYPAERLALMVEDTRAPVVLAHEGFVRALPPATSARIVTMETVSMASHPTSSPHVRLSPEAVCYVVFTSGSTGRPKGIAMSHRGIGNMLAWQTRRAVRAEATTLQFASLNFDVSFQEIFGTWCIGGRLLLSSAELRRDPPALLRYLTQHRVERLFLPFVALQSLSEAARTATELPPLNEVITAGEQLQVTPALVSLFERLPGCILENQYGPSETHAASAWRASGPPRTWPALPSVGTPLTNVQTYVLDARGNPSPVGVPGEVFIGGEGLAHGYHGRPDLTAERFVPSPFSATPGARLYRTGDKARWLSDGQLEFLGRLDGQVKLRGFRVELGEVESALRALPDVRDVVVVLREDTPGFKRLVAYVVQPEAAFSAEALRQALARRLPEYMVPSALVRMDALPLTPSGKVNRNSLPVPTEEAIPGTVYVAPVSAVEKLIADIWAPLLGVPRVGTQDHFFELGGHSLLATQVASRLRESLQMELPVRVLFEAPTLADLAARIEALRQEAHPVKAPSLVRTEAGDSAPQSFPQQRLWFIDALAPGGFAFNVPLFIRCKGPLDVAALERSLAALIDRHESLRTVFAEANGQPVQRVLSSVPFSLAFERLEDVPPQQRDTVLRQRAEERMRHVFDLRSGPLLTATLLRLDAEDHALFLLMHHIITDGWSTDVMGRELGILYDAFTRDQTPRLPPLPIRYTDYARWQRATLQGEALDAQLAWWKRQLSGAPHALELPTDRPRPPVQAQAGAAHMVRIPAAVDAAVRELCHQQGVTSFMALLAGFHALLSRYSGQDDVVVGSPISGRNHREVEGLIGFFVNALPLRVKVSGAESFQVLLARVRETCLGAYAHQEVPFEQLVDALQTPRDLSRTPVFQAVFALFKDFPGFPLRGLETAPVPFDPGLAKHDLTLFMRESATGLLTHWEYNTALFDAATVERMAGHYLRLLEQVTRNPERPLASLSLLTEAERQQLLVEWNDTTLDVPSDLRVPTRIAEQARLRPEALALAGDGQRLTFGELEVRSNQLANLLRAQGVKPETVVALCVDRTPGYVWGALGILKSGGAYLPMDLTWPEAWWRHVLTDSGARIVVTRQAFASRFEGCGVRVLCLDAEPALEAQAVTAPGVALHAEAMAYVIYTSGSTGRPKGVAVTHGTLANLVAGLGTAAGIGPGDRATLLTGLAFDATVFETWPSLSHGASLHLPSDEVRAEPARLVRWLAAEGITLTTLPTPMAEAALEQPWPSGMPLRRVHVAGDVLHRRPGPSVPGQWLNCYGPTENTVIATSGVVKPEAPEGLLPPIGSPEPNVRVYVLDGTGHPVPVGLWGELFLGGAQVARGYLGQPALTAERFGPDPFSREPGARLYRTGDVVRWLADGTLEFRGRADSQVKLRGFRIELGEVEAALLSQPSVKEAVAQVREDVPGQRRLVAYLVLREEATFAVDALRTSLRRSLAEHAVPSAFVVLERLPLTANGKLDRKALPAPDVHRPELSEDYRVPEAGLEQTLAALWAEVLGLERVGASDNFFDLGGNSLLLQSVHAKLEALVGRKVPLVTLFQYPTVRALAGHLSPPKDTPPAAAPAPAQDPGAQRRDNLRRMAQRRGRPGSS